MYKCIIILFCILSFYGSFGEKAMDNTSMQSFIFSKSGLDIHVLRDELENQFKDQFQLDHILPIFPSLEIYHLELHSHTNLELVLSEWFIENFQIQLYKDEILEIRELPDDPQYGEQWALDLIDVAKVWDYTKGGISHSGREIVVAVIDDGFYVEHKELVDNIWQNIKEQPGDQNADGCPGVCGIDDDGDGIIDEDSYGVRLNDAGFDPSAIADDDENGYIDDIFGADIRNKNGFHQSRTHGTKVAGIIGAKGNNSFGISGVNWDVKLMLLSNTQRISDLISAYNYILKERQLFNSSKGIDGSYVVVSNLSSGINRRFAADFPLWCGMYDILGAAGILNVCSTANIDVEIDIEGDMPSTCNSDFLIVVNNTTSQDELYSLTGKSTTHVDLGAPGEETYSLSQNDGFGSFGGASAAAPHVTGAIALLYALDCEQIDINASENPQKTAKAIKSVILNGVDPIPSLASTTLSGGRLNIYSSMIEMNIFCQSTTGDFNLEGVHHVGNNNFILRYETPNFERLHIQIHDMHGRIIYAKAVKPKIFGIKNLEFSIDNANTGIYIATIWQDKDRSSSIFMHTNN